MQGKKLWLGKKELVKFAEEYCYLSKDEAIKIYEECIDALKFSILHIKDYIKTTS